MSRPNIFAYADFASFLRDYTANDPRKRSLRQIAKKIGRAPSLVAMVARGERVASPDLTAEICDCLALSTNQTKFAQNLNAYHRAKTVAQRERHAETLRALRPKNEDLILELDRFQMMSRRHHVVILELITLPGFVEDFAKIATQLGSTVSQSMVKESIALLERVGVVSRNRDGKLVRVPDQIRTPRSVPSIAVRSFHKETLLRAHAAIDQQAVEDRYFSTATIGVAPQLIPEIANRIATFRDELFGYIRQHNDHASQVYHFACQFFRAAEPLEDEKQ